MVEKADKWESVSNRIPSQLMVNLKKARRESRIVALQPNQFPRGLWISLARRVERLPLVYSPASNRIPLPRHASCMKAKRKKA